MSKSKVMHYRRKPDSLNICGQKNASGTVQPKAVTCKRCLKKLEAKKLEAKKLEAKPIPVPATAKPDESTDWNWPLSPDKLDAEMQCRKIKLFGYYRGKYRRKITWHVYSKQLEVQCEQSSWRFSEDKMGMALERYNDPKLYIPEEG